MPETFLARFPVSVRRCVETPKIPATHEKKPLIPRVQQPFHSWANKCYPRARNCLCVTDFPKVWGNFHGYIKKNKRITHGNDSSPGKFYGLIAEPAQGRAPLLQKFKTYRCSFDYDVSVLLMPVRTDSGDRERETLQGRGRGSCSLRLSWQKVNQFGS